MALEPSAATTLLGGLNATLLERLDAGQALESSCERRFKKRECHRLAPIASQHCDGAHGDACYLLSHSALLGSRNTHAMLGLAEPSVASPRSVPDELPSMALLGFVAARCWRYVRVAPARPGRRATVQSDEHTRRLSVAGAQELAHPADARLRRDSGNLRVALAGQCVPFFLADGPRRLTSARVRVDALATTVLEDGSQRRALVVQRIVVDASLAPTLRELRAAFGETLSPLVVLPSEAGGGDDADADGDGAAPSPRASSLRELRAARRLTAWRLIALNGLVLLVNGLVAWRGVLIWQTIQRLRVVEWIHRARPHVGVTLHTMRVLNWATLPVRWPLSRLMGRPLRLAGPPPPPPPPPVYLSAFWRSG